ncbi:MAG: carboxymuconolactone decarboxylase family protein [Planctomycetes bacterium]|jgi:AhpD family alkylhydroperoxidase|nr:carboxymuconolactone decarboxylase family protein [Planctomycetota bacterium]
MMDEKIKELIALGASMACNCHPCVKFHTDKARKMGIDNAKIKMAYDIGQMVRKGAAGQMDELLNDLL